MRIHTILLLAVACLTLASASEDITGLLQVQVDTDTRYHGPISSSSCLVALEAHKESLRASGYGIPRDGEHHPEVGVEGGANTKEFEYLATIAQQVTQNTAKPRICQTGFNYGTSAFAFLCSSDAEVFSWDSGEHEYVSKADELLQKQFPGRHKLILGDSSRSLKEAASNMSKQCDLVFVDGGHTYSLAAADIANFRALATHGATVVVDDCVNTRKAGLIDAGRSVSHSQWIQDVSEAFHDATHDGLVQDVSPSIHFTSYDDDRAVCIGKYVDS